MPKTFAHCSHQQPIRNESEGVTLEQFHPSLAHHIPPHPPSLMPTHIWTSITVTNHCTAPCGTGGQPPPN